MVNKTLSPLFIAMMSGVALFATSEATASFSFTNNSPYYLYDVNKDAGCPGTDYTKPIKPGDSVTSSADWCGFDACTSGGNPAGPGFSSSGCLEASVNGGAPNTQGGYAMWFSLSKTAGCTPGVGSSYGCALNGTNFSLNFSPITQLYSHDDAANGAKAGDVVKVNDVATNGSWLYGGINISGLEYDGTYGDALYQKSDLPEVQYFIDQRMNTVRLPIRWEFVLSDSSTQLAESHNPSSPVLNTEYMTAVHDTVAKFLKGSGNTGKGMKVIVDLHNYMRFCNTGATEGQSNEPTNPSKACRIVTPDEMAYIWGTLATQFSDLLQQYPDQLAFGLMNEPNSDSVNPLTTQQVFDNEVAAYQAIRAYQAAHNLQKNLVIFSGNNWDPLHGWTADNGKVFTMNAFNAAGIDVDTDNIALEMHQYFDRNFSGLSSACNVYTGADDFAQQLAITDLPQWLNDNHMKVLLTEFGGAANANCTADMQLMLDFATTNAYANGKQGGFIGWTAWRVNRHGPASDFNYLQQANYNVYGGNGSASNNGTGITLGSANSLMANVFATYLKPIV